MSNMFENYYNSTPAMARAVRGFRNGHLIIDEVAAVFVKETDNLLRASSIDYVHTEQFRNKAMAKVYAALVELLEE